MRKGTAMMFLLLSMLCGLQIAFAQGRKAISGTVKDASGVGLAGASVTEKGTRNSVLTDESGNFTISVASNANLVVSFVGFVSKTVPASGGDLSISLESGSNNLDEVVVTSLGIGKKQKALGYAVSTVTATQLTDAGTPNFATALYGKAPGVRIGATPGGATSAVNINIRGINSITGKNQPLIVLNGVPIRNQEVSNDNYWGDQRIRGNGLLDIQTEDIDNISILKGASAAALYGSEAVNGVVLITTKTGVRQKKGIGVDFNASYGVENVAFLPRYQNVRGYGMATSWVNTTLSNNPDGFFYVDMDGDGIRETRSVPNASINYGPKFDGKPTLSWDGKIRPYEAQGDAYNNFYQQGSNSNVNVAVTQSSDRMNLRLSLSRQDNQMISIGSNNVKNNFNLNASFKVGKNFTTDVLVNFINQSTKNRPYSIDRMTNNFTGMIGRFDNAQWYIDKFQTSKGYRFVTGTGQSITPLENINGGYGGFKGDIADYLWRVYKNTSLETENRLIASITNNWQIVKGLSLRTRTSTDYTTGQTESKAYTERPLAFGNSGGFGMSSGYYSILYTDVLMTYNREIMKDLEWNVMGGYTASEDKSFNTSRSTNGGLSSENLFDIAASVNVANSGSSRLSLVKDAILATTNLNYKDYLFLEGTVRRDRTSTMNPNNNAFIYPSVNASFIFSDALKMPEFINYGKFRASWGVVGNYPDAYRANVAYSQGTLGNQGGTQPVLFTTIPGSFGNDLIRPEQKHEIELGVESRMFNNRVTLEASYYNAQVRDQILPQTIPVSSGASSILTNIGTLRNSGIELALSGFVIKNRNLSWETGINVSKNWNKVEQLAPGLTELLHADYDGNAAQLRSVVGQPMGDLYARPIETNAKGEKIVSPNGLYKVDATKWIKVGNAMPKVVGGWFNTINYKGITLDAMIDYRIGGHVMPTGLYWMLGRGLLEESLQWMDKESGGLSYYVNAGGQRIQTSSDKGPNGEKVYHDGVLLPGVKADGTQNDVITSQANYFWTVYNWGGPQYSPNTRYDLYINENSYVKFREVTLSYRMPASISKLIGAQSLQVSVFGRNLFYLYRTIKNMDAEQTTAGSRWTQQVNNIGTNPSTRAYGVMIRAKF